MRQIRTGTCGRLGQLAFMAAVTACLLALAFEAATGSGGLARATVYAFAAGFGLEFVGAAWSGRRRRSGGEKQATG